MANELGSGSGSGYPTSIDLDAVTESGSTAVRANVPNDLAAAIIKIQQTVGISPAGSKTTVVERLDVTQNANGTLKNAVALDQPTFSDFTNATHDHSNEAGGGLDIVRGSGPFNIKSNFDNLIVKQTAVTTVDVDADWVTLYKANGQAIKVSSLNITLDISSGVALLGLDTGAEANVWYHVWVVAKLDGTLSGVLSASPVLATVLTNVSGIDATYIYAVYAGSVQNVSGDLVASYQINNRVRSKQGTSITVSATSATDTDISAYIPTTAKLVNFTGRNGTSGSALYIHPLTFSVGVGASWHDYLHSGSGGSQHNGTCPIETAQHIWVARATDNFTVYFHGWEY